MNDPIAQIIIEPAEIQRLRELFFSKFFKKAFPQSIVPVGTMHFVLVSGMPMGLKYSFHQVLDLLKLNGSSKAYAMPLQVLNDKSDTLYHKTFVLKQIDKYHISPATQFAVQSTYDDIVALSNSQFLYTSWDDYFVFDESLSWIMQYVSYKQMFILFFDDPAIISKTTIPEDVLYDLESFLKNCSDEVNQTELDALKEYWLPNQYKFDMK